MGVTYRYMGTSHSLGVDKEALIFLYIYENILNFINLKTDEAMGYNRQ